MNHSPTFYLNEFSAEIMFRNQSIAITATKPHLQLIAQRLAEQYNFPFIKAFEQKKFEFSLILTEQGLCFQHTKKKEWGNLKIDFLKGKIAYRLRHISDQKQLLAKAMGRKLHSKTTVLDLTAGLGHDGFILAQLGFSVTLLERSAVIAALLDNGLHRALNHGKYSHISAQPQLIHTEATIFLKKVLQTKQFPDIIYLDPMYPCSRKSALAKKEMCLLRKIVGNDTDADSLLPLALACAQRVVVKRPRLAVFLAQLNPHHSIFGKQHRFDIYLTNKPNQTVCLSA